LELYSVIKELLASNDFVSLQGIGSFVQKYEPAKLSPDGKSILPPHQSVSFDQSRTFNDGLLERHLRDKHNLSSIDAANRVKDFIETLNKRISSGSTVTFDSIGTLSKTSSGSIVFTPADDLHRSSETFGLVEPVKVPEQKSSIASETPAKEPVKPQPIAPSKAQKASQLSSVGIPIMLAAAAMAILMVVGSLLIFVPELRFWNDQEVAYAEPPAHNIELVSQVETPSFTQADTTDTLSALNDNLEPTPQKVEEKVAVITDKKQALYYEEPDDKTYYIIAGSFEHIDNAQVLFNSLAKQGYNPEILQSDGRFRVSISKFTDRNRALRELARLRQQKSTESVWMLGL
jgi:cell division protein FtsN/nucleoid DNA-binding protein